MVKLEKEWLKVFMLVVFSISLTFLILELLFRTFNPISFDSLISHSTKRWTDADIFLDTQVARVSGTLGYEWTPNAKKGWLHINSLGMYDREREKEKPWGAYRIIFLGDSTTANSDYVGMLEKLLNRKKQSYEAWNCAVTGYDLSQYCQALKEKWINYGPDMVVIGFCLNDFETTPLFIKENNRVVGYFPKKEVLPFISPFLLKHSALYRFIVVRLAASKKVDRQERIIKAGRAYLREIKDLLSAKDVRLLVVIFGLTSKWEDTQKVWRDNYEQIKQILNDYAIDSLDTVPLFQQNNPASLRLGDELHFNQKGSQIIAEAIYSKLKQSLKIE